MRKGLKEERDDNLKVEGEKKLPAVHRGDAPPKNMIFAPQPEVGCRHFCHLCQDAGIPLRPRDVHCRTLNMSQTSLCP
jgi:hypothetical protein